MVSVKCPHILSQKYLRVVWGFRLRRSTSGRRRCEASERRRFHSPCAGFLRRSRLSHRPCLHLGHTMTLDLFPLRSVFRNATESDAQQNPGVQVQSHLSTFGFGSSFFSLSLSLLCSPGWNPKIVLDVSHCSYRKWSSACINPSMIQVGGVWVGGDWTWLFFPAKLSKQNKQISMSAYCSEGKQLTVPAAGWLNTIRND